MFPIRDNIRTETVPVVTIVIIALNSLVWLYEVSLGSRIEYFILGHGLTPWRFTHYYLYQGGFWDNAVTPLFWSIFMHAGWMHIIGNMWFLWIFGDNVEDRLGHFNYLIFYLLCGIGASLTQVRVLSQRQNPDCGGKRRHKWGSGGLSDKFSKRSHLYSLNNFRYYSACRTSRILISDFLVRISVCRRGCPGRRCRECGRRSILGSHGRVCYRYSALVAHA